MICLVIFVVSIGVTILPTALFQVPVHYVYTRQES